MLRSRCRAGTASSGCCGVSCHNFSSCCIGHPADVAQRIKLCRWLLMCANASAFHLVILSFEKELQMIVIHGTYMRTCFRSCRELMYLYIYIHKYNTFIYIYIHTYFTYIYIYIYTYTNTFIAHVYSYDLFTFREYIYIYIEYDSILKVFSLCVNKSLVPEQHVHFLKLQQC